MFILLIKLIDILHENKKKIHNHISGMLIYVVRIWRDVLKDIGRAKLVLNIRNRSMYL